MWISGQHGFLHTLIPHSSLLIRMYSAFPERVGELRETVNEKRRRRRAAENSKTTLDLNEKSEYSYKLFGKVPGNPFAADSVDLAFESWGNAIGSAVTFTKTVSEDDHNV